MREELLLNLSFTGTVLGMLLLFFLVEYTDNAFLALPLKQGEHGILEGVVERVHEGTALRFTLKQESLVTIVVFHPLDFTVKKGMRVQVVGTAREDNALIADAVRILG